MLVLIVFCFLSLLLIGWIVLPVEVRDAMTRSSSVHGRGHHQTKALQNLGILVQFFGGILVMALLIAAPVTAFLYVVDQTIIPLGLATDAIAEAELTPSRWKSNLTEGPQNVSQRHAHWSMTQGRSMQDARSMQRVLFNVFPIILIASVILLLVSSRFAGGILDVAFKDLQRKANKIYVDDIREDYLRSNRR